MYRNNSTLTKFQKQCKLECKLNILKKKKTINTLKYIYKQQNASSLYIAGIEIKSQKYLKIIEINDLIEYFYE